ncbi:MAG: hypothetical protein HQL32_00235 [Planctomycetes bacterium]|nr:hypothetical protein [Planctomycetota bacterium]
MIIAIDPSINHIGFASLKSDGSFVSSRHITPKKALKGNTLAKLNALFMELQDELRKYPEASEIIIEHTRFFARNNNSSHASAQKLNIAKGMIYGVCRSTLSCPVHLAWLPGFGKDQANLLARAHKLPKNITQHERDAFWLGNSWATLPKAIKQAHLDNKDL